MHTWAYRALLASILGLSLIASACGSSGGGSPSSSKGTITVAGFNFPESSILANVYGQALKGSGWTAKYKLNLGNRELVEPALERGDIDLYPGYAATELEFINGAKGEATPNAAQTVANSRTVAHELISRGFRLVSGGSVNHLCLVDVTSKGLTGKVAERSK